MKKFFLALGLIFAVQNTTFAQNIEVPIVPVKSYNTFDNTLMEGDSLDFVVSKNIYKGKNLLIKKGDKVTGLLTSRKDNGFYGQTASLFIEQFRLQNGKSLKGEILQKGNEHANIFDYLPFAWLLARPIRGGEAEISPECQYILIIED